MYKLLIEDDEGGKTAVSLTREELTIGRKEGNTIRLTDRNVSRRHGRIVREDDRIFVEDVDARYGIKKNGKRIEEREQLEEGDVVLIGDYRLTLKSDTKGKKKKDKGKDKAGPPAMPKDKSGTGDFDDDRSEQTQIIQTMPAKLVVISSNFAGEEFPLVDEEMVIGRGENCNIIIDHRSISGKHAKIVREDNKTYKIVDLNSKNGVKVSGDTYRATLLQRGDVIELGYVKFRFVEPGENYVFTPQSVEEPVPSPSSSGGLDTKMMVGVFAGVLALVFVAGLLVIVGGDEESEAVEEPVDDESAMAIQEIEELEEEGDEGRVDVAIDRAEEAIQAGRLQEPTTRLETIRDMMDPSPDQEERMSSLERDIQNMRPFKSNYEEAVSASENGEFVVALEEADQIPGHLALRTRLEEEGVMDDIFEGILAMADEQLEEENLEQARELANEILLVDSNFEPAHELLDRIEDRESELEAIAARQQEAAVAQANTTSGGSSPSPTPDPTPEPETGSSSGSAPSADEARQMYIQAARKVTGGSPQEAIDICTQALQAGHTDCHRILGLAYGRLNDSSSACRHFEQYLSTNPSNPGAVESQMENYGCAP